MDEPALWQPTCVAWMALYAVDSMYCCEELRMSFLSNIQEIRDRARQQIENGAITKDYKLDRAQAISF